MSTGNTKAAQPICTLVEEMVSHDHKDLALDKRPTVINYFAGYLLVALTSRRDG